MEMAGPERQDKTKTPLYRAQFFSRVSFNAIHANKVRHPFYVSIELNWAQARSVIRWTLRLANQTNRRINPIMVEI